MESLVTIGGSIDKEVSNHTSDAIVKILKASLEHRSSEVTIAAIKALSVGFDASMSGDNCFDSCNFSTNGPVDCDADDIKRAAE